jgi:hypothetical protein
MAAPLTNRDVDWDRWPVTEYLDEVYRAIQPEDEAVLVHHSAFYRQFAPGPVRPVWSWAPGPIWTR